MRPEARKKLGFFAAPEGAIASILPRLAPPLDKSGLALLDPCAGEGKAIGQLATCLGVSLDRVWAVELGRELGEACRQNLPGASILAPCSFLQTDIRYGSYSLVYCNPPFDDSLSTGIRVEEQFLSLSLKLLVKGGILLFVCPESIAMRSGFQGMIGMYCDRVSVVPFPMKVRKHAEVFVLAQRIDGFRLKAPSWRDLIAREGWKYTLPPAPGPGQRFTKTGLTDDELFEYLERSPLLGQFAQPAPFTMPSPPLALGKGHLALLLAGGFLDGLVPGVIPHVVRGSARKVEEQTDVEVDKSRDQTVTKETLTERIKLQIRAVWPDGIVRTLE